MAHRTFGPTSAGLLAIGVASWLGTGATSLSGQTECDPNFAPEAAFGASCASTACSFSLTSPIPASGIDELEWDFGDGATSEGTAPSVSHDYSAGGYYLVTLVVTAGDGQIATATAGVMLGPGFPLAADDSLVTDRDVPLTITTAELLSNDAFGVSFDHANPAKCPVPPGGTACTYTPPYHYVGVDTFQYTVRDAAGNTGTAAVAVTVRPALVANPDYLETTMNVPIRVTSAQLLQNDTPGAVFVTAENPSYGDLRLVETTPAWVEYEFTPAPGFVGDAGFEYLISRDGNPPFERGIVTVHIIDSPPTAMFRVWATGPPRTFSVRSQSTDDVGVVRWIWDWGDGTVVETTEPDVDQTHTYAVSGHYTITHTVFDTAGQSGSFARFVVANTPPVAVDDTATTERDIPVVVDVLANDSDVDGDSLTPYYLVTQHPGAAANLVQTPSGWAVRFTPPDSFVGTTTFDYTAADPWSGTSTARVTVTVNQWSSITDALGEQFTCLKNGSLPIPISLLLANDYDEDGDPLTIVAFDTTLLMGTLDCTTDPTRCTYTPPFGGTGQSFFRYTVEDPAGHRDTASVRLYVSVAGSAPILNDDYFTNDDDFIRERAMSFTIQDVVQNDVDADGDTLTVTLSSGAKDFGSVACTTPMYECTYTPGTGFIGADRFLYTATDTINPAATAYINVLTLPLAAPSFDAREDLYPAPQSQTYIPNTFLTNNDYDPEGDPITVSSIDPTGLMGTLTCDGAGCIFRPGIGFSGRTSFKYTATDGHGSTDTATVRIRVGSANSEPVARPDSFSTPRNTPLRFSVFEVLGNDYDPDNDPLGVAVYSSGAQKGSLSCGNPQYWCTYTPNPNVTGTDTITYALNDGSTVTSTFTVTILP